MSSYNNIEKIKYSQNPDGIVTLQEYILFEDDRAQEKYIVFKFMNNLNQRLHEIKFEVVQYNAANEILEKSVVVHNNFIAEENSPFVPNAKLQVNYDCKSISVNIIFAAFDRIKWEYGEFSDNTFKFDRYASSKTIPAPAPALPAAKLTKKSKKQKKEISKYAFTVKDISKRNIAVIPRIFNVMLFVLVVAAVVVSLLLFIHKSEKVYIDGFALEYYVEGSGDNAEKYATIVAYDGFETQLTIPAEIGGYRIEKIAENSFNNSKVTNITFDTGALRIESNAFINCHSLTDINCTDGCGTITMMSYAFNGCDMLTSVNLPNAVLSVNSFNNSLIVKHLSFDSFVGSSKQLISLFGETAEKLDINTLNVNLPIITSDFLYNVTVNDFTFNHDCYIEYGALENVAFIANRYVKTDYCEMLAGEIVSVRVVDGTFVLPKNVTSFDVNKFYSVLSQVTSLKLEITSTDELVMDAAFFAPFSNVTSLEVTEKGVVSPQTLTYLPYLNQFIAPVQALPLSTFLSGTNVTSVGITGSDIVTESYMKGLMRISEVYIADSVSSVESGAFAQTNLTSLSIPLFGEKYNANTSLLNRYPYGLKNLTEVEIRPSGSNTAIAENFFEGLLKLTTIKVAEGFVSCGKNIVDYHPMLTKLSLPQSLTGYNGFPTIGNGCQNLTTVSASFNSNMPSTYSTFNACAASTVNLALNRDSGSIPADFFDANYTQIKRLSLTCNTFGGEWKGILNKFNNLEYLHIKANSITMGLTDLFDAEASIKINTLVVECKAVPDSFFKGDFKFGDIILIGTQTLNGDISTNNSVTSIYIPDTLQYNEELINVLKTLNVSIIHFGGSKPDGVVINLPNVSYLWNVKPFVLFDFS